MQFSDYLQGLFTRVSDKCTRELHNSKRDLNLPLLKTSLGQKSFSFRGAKLWNKLGCEAKATSSYSAFKEAVTFSRVKKIATTKAWHVQSMLVETFHFIFIFIFNFVNTVAPSVDQQLLFRGLWQKSKN